MPREIFESEQLEDDPFNNITDWSLKQFQRIYSSEVTKEDLWEYLYGVMHARDWRDKFKSELQKNLPKIPLAPGGIEVFRQFQAAGQELFELHVEYENGPEADLDVVLDEGGHYRIVDRMRWDEEKTELRINETCRIVNIPKNAHSYQISGRSPLEWAVDSLRRKIDKNSGIIDDPNEWRAWKDDPFELVRHLRRLAHIGIRSAAIIDSLPPSLPSQEI